MKCKVKGCNKNVWVKKHGLCEAHMMRLRRKGDVGKGKVRKYNSIPPFNHQI